MRIRTVLPYVLSVSTLACSTRVDARLDIARDARTPRPQFTIASPLTPRAIFVERQETAPEDHQGKTMWTLMAAPGAAAVLPAVLTYGDVLRGFTEARPAAALFPGRYSLIVAFPEGRSSIDFDVGNDGRVRKPGL